MAWAAADGGAHGRRRGAAPGRSRPGGCSPRSATSLTIGLRPPVPWVVCSRACTGTRGGVANPSRDGLCGWRSRRLRGSKKAVPGLFPPPTRRRPEAHRVYGNEPDRTLTVVTFAPQARPARIRAGNENSRRARVVRSPAGFVPSQRNASGRTEKVSEMGGYRWRRRWHWALQPGRRARFSVASHGRHVRG